MKKLFSLCTFSIIFLNSFAQELICPFTDSFFIDAPPQYTISSLTTDGNIISDTKTLLNFQLKCKSFTSTESGEAFLIISKNSTDLCTLHIIDGPYEMTPIISFIECVGNLKYASFKHSWGTYEYIIKFED
ncbi:hypothetical protein N9L02_01250 [Gammaproteobacteria bacterium]|nr:hypothetical protein [Gammaproteobacteria bacterium]